MTQQVTPMVQQRGPGSDVAETTANTHWDAEALSGSFAGLSTQPSLEAYSSGIPSINMSGTEDTGSNTPLTLVPMAHSMLKQSSNASEQASEQQLDSPTGRRRLFFAQAGPDCGEEHIRAVFAPYGSVEQVQLFQQDAPAASGPGASSNSCGYVTMGSSDQAAAALAALQHGPQLPQPVGCLSVSWALSEQEQQAAAAPTSQQPAALAANAGRTVFFAKVPPSALASEVEQLFGSFGKLSEVNLFRAWAGAKHSKGCGLITYVDRASAGAAIGQLHGKYVFPGSDCPMVVEWMDLKKQRPIAPAPTMDKPPLGCSCDAYKLLLGNLPAGTSEDDLALLLGQFGRVVQVSLAPDNNGVTSSGHIWYATKLGAEALTNRVRAEPLWLRDPRTQQDLPLSVKKARRPGAPGNSSGPLGAPLFPPRPNNACSGSSSSSNLLPMLCIPGDSGGQLLQMQQSCGGLGLLSPDVLRLLPMQQMATHLSLQHNAQQRAINSQMCCMPGSMLTSTSGNHAMSSPANIVSINEFEGSFNMPRGPHMQQAQQQAMALAQLPSQQQQQLAAAAVAGGMMWQQQPPQQPQVSQQMLVLPHSAGMVAASAHMAAMNGLPNGHQQQQQAAVAALAHAGSMPSGGTSGAGGYKSIAVPVEAAEVQLIAQNLGFFAGHSGAQVTITSLPGAGLAVMVSGSAGQVAVAQSLLSAARASRH